MDLEALYELDVAALDVLARMHERIVRQARARIAELRGIDAMHERTRQALNALHALPGLVREQLELGRDLEYAMRHTAQVAETPIETVRHYWQAWIKARDQATVAQRRILVARLAGKGLSNAHISTRTGIPDYTVARDLGYVKTL